jgi:thiol:disulfide interchange protein DsbG
MRNLILATTLLAAPVSALAAGPSCAVPPSPQEAATIRAPQTIIDDTVSVPAPVNPQTEVARVGSRTTVPAPAPVPAPQSARTLAPAKPLPPHAPGTPQPLSATEIGAVPALQRIASAGATLLDLGTEHGLHTIFATKADAFQIFYLVPDGSAVIGGVMWDASGHDVTRDQVAPIPGVIPTIKVGPGGAPAKASPADDRSQGTDPLSLVKEATYGTVGSPDAAQLWMFVDPFCSFSVNAMRQLAPYVQSGKVRLSVIPLSVLDYEDQGRSTPAAQIMVSEPKSRMVADWVAGSLSGMPSADAAVLLGRNMAIAGALHLRGTPTFIWRASDGSAGRADGIPPDLNAVIASIGK